MSWLHTPRESATVLSTNNLELGASFRDAPLPGLRYEIGGAVDVPSRTYARAGTAFSSSTPYHYLYPMLPRRFLYNRRGAGWNPQRFLVSSVAIVPHARIEWDPIREMALGLEVDVPVLVDADNGRFTVLPQVAIEVAGRFEGACLAGVRAELTTSPARGFPGQGGVSVSAEPFLRLALPVERTNVFVRLGLRVPFGPAYPFIASHPIGFIGGTLAAGALY